MLRTIFVVAVVLSGGFGSARADQASDTAEIIATLSKLKDGFLFQDSTVIRDVMTSDGVLTTPFYGAPFSVDQIVDNLPVFKINSHGSHDLIVTFLDSSTALMTLYTSFDGTYNGKQLPPWVFASAVWVNQGDGWRLRNYQETAVDTPNWDAMRPGGKPTSGLQAGSSTKTQ